MLMFVTMLSTGIGEAVEKLSQPLSCAKTLDYKSCQTILCLTKEMARQLLPCIPASVALAGVLLHLHFLSLSAIVHNP